MVVIVGLFAEVLFLPFIENPTVQLINAAYWGGVALLLAWLLSVRVSLHDDGITYRSLFGSKEMRWDEVERFYYGVSAPQEAVTVSEDEEKFTSSYSIKPIDSQRRKISFGSWRIRRAKQLGAKLVEHTYAPLLRKAAQLFDSGAELAFGAIRVSRDGGLKVKKAFGFKSIPWKQISEVQIGEEGFYLCQGGEKYTLFPLSKIPNAFALCGLLGRHLQSGTTFQ
ncbi:PH domain-containing protein [Acidobacteriia bacterium AH_259_A11_L15]|nr:PH domain-containing protein [Acidobacteriia bacterium AH_259_A11_L15]